MDFQILKIVKSIYHVTEVVQAVGGTYSSWWANQFDLKPHKNV